MRINLNQLSVFYTAARLKSMAAAAKALYVSPPAVTMQIKKLEGWLGFPVFERGLGQLRLTERGQSLYNAIDPLFSGLDNLEQYIEGLMDAEEGKVRLGTHHLPGNYFIPDLIAQVRAKHPRLKVQMDLGTQDELLEKLFQQKLDLVLIIGDPPEGARCRTQHLFDEELALVTASNSNFARTKQISIKDIGRIPLILQQKGTGAQRAVLNYLEAQGVEPNIMLDNLSSDVIKRFLPKMHAASFIGRFIVQKELDEGVFHEIKVEEGTALCHFSLAYNDNEFIPLKLENFLSALEGFRPSFMSNH